MTPRDARATEIFIDNLTITHGPKAWEMPAMNDFHAQRSQLLHGQGVVDTIGMINIVNQRTVIDCIA